MKNKRAHSRLMAQGLTDFYADHVIKCLLSIGMPVEKITKEMTAKEILEVLAKIDKITTEKVLNTIGKVS